MPTCDQCGRRVDETYQCEDCGGTYCADHRTPLLHGCREGARGGDARGGGVATDEDDPGASFETLVVLASAAAAAVFLLVAAVAVGVLSPPDVLENGPLGGDATTTPGVTEPFDESEFRATVLSAVDERRRELGTGTLSVDERRQAVAERMAEDMAAHDYFDNASAQDSPLFSVERRLAAANRSCEDGPLASYFMKTYYGQRIQTGSGVEVYTSTAEVAQNAASEMVEDVASVNEKSTFDRHALGVHETDDGSVYVVYVAC